ncbi:hypothetical protein J6590_001079 [Homalodisca vitripennis]|nr:hypothetical protein J6590_001079 [Homalodisca vitripennis]
MTPRVARKPESITTPKERSSTFFGVLYVTRCSQNSKELKLSPEETIKSEQPRSARPVWDWEVRSSEEFCGTRTHSVPDYSEISIYSFMPIVARKPESITTPKERSSTFFGVLYVTRCSQNSKELKLSPEETIKSEQPRSARPVWDWEVRSSEEFCGTRTHSVPDYSEISIYSFMPIVARKPESITTPKERSSTFFGVLYVTRCSQNSKELKLSPEETIKSEQPRSARPVWDWEVRSSEEFCGTRTHSVPDYSEISIYSFMPM